MPAPSDLDAVFKTFRAIKLTPAEDSEILASLRKMCLKPPDALPADKKVGNLSKKKGDTHV